MLKRDFSDIVYRALANYFDAQVINSNIRKQGKKAFLVDASDSTQVSAGTTLIVQVEPPNGKVWKVLAVLVDIPPPSGATTGNHALGFRLMNLGWLGPICTADYADYIRYIYFKPYSGSWSPETEIALIEAFKSFRITKSYPLSISYRNNTDAEQTGTRRVYLVVEEYDEVS